MTGPDEIMTVAGLQDSLSQLAALGATVATRPPVVHEIDYMLNDLRQAQRLLVAGSDERRALARQDGGSEARNRARRRIYGEDLKTYRCPPTLESAKFEPTADRDL